MIGTMGWQQLLLIFLILALLFGARRVSDIGGALGRGIKEFKREVRDPEEEGAEATDQAAATTEAEEREQPRT